MPWSFEHSSDARIINEKLYLLCTHRATCISQTQAIKIRSIGRFRFPVCRHLRTWLGPEESDEDSDAGTFFDHACISEIGNHWREIKSRYTGIGSCALCYTDYRTFVDWGYAGHNVALTTYHRLGSCRTPIEGVWQSLMATFECSSRFNNSQAFDVGEVRRRWHESSGDMIDNHIMTHWADPYLEAFYKKTKTDWDELLVIAGRIRYSYFDTQNRAFPSS